jgi:hypothetical protein
VSDIIAIFRRGRRHSIGFCIDGRWSRLYTQQGELRTWGSPRAARAFLEATARSYQADYGEPLPWDVAAVPVREAPA